MTAPGGPPVVFVGGFLTSPIVYRRMRRRLLLRGASSVRIVSLWTPEWLLAAAVGLHPLLDRVARAIDEEYEAAGRRPVLLIGHSAGGLLARLAIGPRAFRGRAFTHPERVGALVTLGTPHRYGPPHRRSRITWEAAQFLQDAAPGAYWAPTVGYLSVASRLVQGGGWRHGWRRWSAAWFYSTILGADAGAGWGDSLVPVDACQLEGARCLTLEGVAHGQEWPSWYGAERGLDGWWDAAVATWREAVTARERLNEAA